MIDDTEQNSAPAPPSAWRRLREAYEFKLMTDTSFRATVVAVKVVLFALALAATLFVALIEPSPTPGFLERAFSR